MDSSAFDTIIIGAGAAGLMCAAITGQNGRKVLLLDHAKRAGEKIRISGGGRCNFTNTHCTAENFISQNPHFCKSALAGYNPQDFIELLERYKISWHEKTLGQLFCDERATQIIEMLLAECALGNVATLFDTKILQVEKSATGFLVSTNNNSFTTNSLVIACGGKSIPKMGASDYGYKLARQFGLKVVEPVAALVPLSLDQVFEQPVSTLAGVSLPVRATCNGKSFAEAMLFTHRGLSGPVVLQISSYWSPGESIVIDLLPGVDMLQLSKQAKESNPKQSLVGFLSGFLPKRLAACIAATLTQQFLGEFRDATLSQLSDRLHNWQITPPSSLGFRVAEVTRGGIDTNELSSKTMQSKAVPGLYFIGEVVDVTGHLGGHNFQWAWASGFACGRFI